ncbi:MAG: uroporphyrinogen decarboxylase family protein [Kiritimatiellia bacterium]
MNILDSILDVYRGKSPAKVPFMLDLSHWFYHRNRMPWDLSKAYEKPEYELIDYHRSKGVGFYMPNLASFFATAFRPEVQVEIRKSDAGGRTRIAWRYTTPIGMIERVRAWDETTYSWHIENWGVKTEQDLRVLAFALSGRTFTPAWHKFDAWRKYVGDLGVVYITTGYSGMGQLLNYWMGVEGTIYAIADWPETVRAAVDQINASNLDMIDCLAGSPAQVVCMGDNFSSDIQPPAFFNEWSRGYYVEAIRRLHAAGKYVAVHIDGRLRGALAMIRGAGADCADAVTPKPMGDLIPDECFEEAGTQFILSGGVSPDLWLPNRPLGEFKKAVIAWLDLSRRGARIIANAGDQVPPGAEEARIEIMRDMVEQHNRTLAGQT